MKNGGRGLTRSHADPKAEERKGRPNFSFLCATSVFSVPLRLKILSRDPPRRDREPEGHREFSNQAPPKVTGSQQFISSSSDPRLSA